MDCLNCGSEMNIGDNELVCRRCNVSYSKGEWDIPEELLPTEKQRKTIQLINNRLHLGVEAMTKGQCNRVIGEFFEEALNTPPLSEHDYKKYVSNRVSDWTVFTDYLNHNGEKSCLVLSKNSYSFEKACAFAQKAFECKEGNLNISSGFLSKKENEVYLHTENEDGLCCPVWIITENKNGTYRVYPDSTDNVREISKRVSGFNDKGE